MLLFRPASLADSDAIVALVTSAYRGDESRGGWTTEADLIDGPRITPEVLADDLAEPSGRLLVGFEGDEMLACCNLVDKGDGVAYFGMFAVMPGRQGAGLGKQVLEEAARISRDEWGSTTLEMTVLEPRDELIAFYERRGFVRTGEYREFPYGDERFGTPKRDDLHMVVLAKPL
ncbi:GNAT family N-acetyltransferase [Frondihabitans australicus]|uniref:Acetyltransferase (GNAT) family protein n=1 Tax=Frondihabitans australicus TaxID=386892 RepID=A0A495IIZ7_9MICO|nr:GNAT family N-acetyltransferase [Frondihabitans australicus]RKR75739.1 acetyltransferase (GNAT) family protein [Frondihabitans australicus]